MNKKAPKTPPEVAVKKAPRAKKTPPAASPSKVTSNKKASVPKESTGLVEKFKNLFKK